MLQPVDSASYNADRLRAQADTLQRRAESLRVEASELSHEAMELRVEADRMTRGSVGFVNGHGKASPTPDPFDVFDGRVRVVLEGAGPLAMSDLTRHLNASSTRVRAALARLEDAGVIQKSGIKRGTRYRLADDDEVATVHPFTSYEAMVRDAAKKLGTFELVDLQRALPDLAEGTLRRWVRKLEQRELFDSERVGTTKVYAYVRPTDEGPTKPKTKQAPEWHPTNIGIMHARGAVVAGTNNTRTGSAIVNALIREVRDVAPDVTTKRTAHKITFMRDGEEIAHCSKTPGASSLKRSRSALRKAGVPVGEK